MSIHKKTLKQLPQLPFRCNYYYPKVSFYPQYSNTIIVCTDSTEHGIIKYNLDNNEWQILQKYPSGIIVSEHGQFIDYNNHIVFVVGGLGNVFLKFNLKTNKITNITGICSLQLPQTVQFSLQTDHKIYIFTHYKNQMEFDTNKQIFLPIDPNIDAVVETETTYLKSVYCESTKQLMMLGGDSSDNIYYCNLKSENIKCEWKLNNKIKMPHVVNDEMFYDVLIFKDVIIVLYFGDYNNNDIWCLDLLHFKWYKSQYDVPIDINGGYCIKSNNNDDVHVLNFHNTQHFVTDVYDLFSKDMIKQRRNDYEMLVAGFIKDQENNNIPWGYLPWVLKQLILLYFPVFA